MIRFRHLNFALAVFLIATVVTADQVVPVLEFPEPGMDDPARYQNYTTRFFRDSAKNVLQIYLQKNTGRVVHLWADSANESLAFTARDSGGKPVDVKWCDQSADATNTAEGRFLQYSLCASSDSVEIGHFLLGTMRKERDFQYFEKHLAPFESESFHEPELLKLIEILKQLPTEEQNRQLRFLRAESIEQLRNRMDPDIRVTPKQVIAVRHVSFDGRNHLWLQIGTEGKKTELRGNKVIVRSDGSPIRFTIRVGTDSAALTPLDRSEIFNEPFLQFFDEQKKQGASSKWLAREVTGMELVCYKEKLMAGLPNFATYFGRDTMMSALMLESVWSVGMLEHAISSVLRKVSAAGEVSHEEALGGQAIRENAGEYNKLMESYLAQDNPEAGLLEQARNILQNLQAVRENYNMVDDDFQLPVLLGRYLANPAVPAERKLEFLLASPGPSAGSRLSIVLKNFAYAFALAQPYVNNPQAIHLVSFPKSPEGGWMSASWRDSQAGYARGRFAMDVNVIWVPIAIDAISATLDFLSDRGMTAEKLITAHGKKIDSNRSEFISNPDLLRKAKQVWKDSAKHFRVNYSREEVTKSIQDKLAWLPQEEAKFWNAIVQKKESIPKRLSFLALSLDEKGNPIPVLNSDPATLLFLSDYTEKILNKQAEPEDVYELVDPFLVPYPAGLFVEKLGVLCANDAYSSKEVWERFRKDHYHSPTVVWGREVNLVTLGFIRALVQAHGTDGKLKSESLSSYVTYLKNALQQTKGAVEESGLKHNELWSYRIENGMLLPTRYASSTDIQLWNLTDVSIQFWMNEVNRIK